MREITKGKKYRHFKGDIVTIIALAKDSETEKELVVYEHNNTIWVRDKKMFLEPLDKEKYPNANQEYRFEEIW